MEQMGDSSGEASPLLSEEVANARMERWLAQDRAATLERRLAEMEQELALRDDRLRRVTDELLLERERRTTADATVASLQQEAAALQTTFWWRLGRGPRWVRRHFR